MKRNQLKELGLTDEQINQVMDLNGKDINSVKEEVSTLTTANENFKSQIAERDKDLKNLRSQVKDNEDLSNQFKELQGKYKNDTTKLTNELNQTKLNNAVDRKLSANNVRNVKAVKALLNMDSVKLDDNGNLSGLDDQIKTIKQSDSYLFNEGTKQNYEPSNGKPATTDQTQAMIDVFKS
ncbi:phage scaffolding protein [Lactobacillus sp. PSON]|uniref:phage scaffolding protein n=1 Tax=Lactobacillus sp. PSON TaxID=3455454 RepID=UPI0040437A49